MSKRKKQFIEHSRCVNGRNLREFLLKIGKTEEEVVIKKIRVLSELEEERDAHSLYFNVSWRG